MMTIRVSRWWRATCRAALGVLSLACAGASTVSSPRTRAEQSHYQATSTYADVVAFLDTLRIHERSIAVGSIGRTNEGRTIPYVIVSRPLVTTPAEARALGRPIVYVNANIHAGEVEGKDAILALVRDLVSSSRPNVLDSLVLIAVPIYNADGNERFASQAVNRTEQRGPELVGIRENASGLDLNRDYTKAEAPETRGALTMFSTWDPDVYVDLHTTDGSYHGFALTYSPSLTPMSNLPGFSGTLTRDTLLPEIRRALRTHGIETFDYGNFGNFDDDEHDVTDTVKRAWYTFDHRPRFGTNYYGLRGGVSILSEAYSHDPFERRVASTYAFVNEILSTVVRHRDQILHDHRGGGAGNGAPSPLTHVPVRAQVTTHPFEREIPFEILRHTGDLTLSQAGVPKGVRRTGRFVTQRMPVYDRFEPTLFVDLPAAYVIPAGYPQVIALLRLHGLAMQPATGATVSGSEFVIDSVHHAAGRFQGHLETRVYGHWRTVTRAMPQGATRVDATGRLGPLAAYLLDPESDDGLVDWNFFDPSLRPGNVYPVFRVSR